MFAVKALAIFGTILLGLLGVPALFAVMFNDTSQPPHMAVQSPAMNFVPLFMIVSFLIGIFLAVQIGKDQA